MMPELAAGFGLHPNRICTPRHELMDDAAAAFDAGPSPRDEAREAALVDADAKIGKLTFELDCPARRSGRRAVRTARR